MNLTWQDIHKRYVVKNERNGKLATIGGINEAVKKDEDFKFMCSCLRADIYRYDNLGSKWAVHLKPAVGGKKRRALWNKLEALKLDRVQTGDFEAVWVFDADKFDEIAGIVKLHVRHTRKKVTHEVLI